MMAKEDWLIGRIVSIAFWRSYQVYTVICTHASDSKCGLAICDISPHKLLEGYNLGIGFMQTSL